MHSPYYCCGGKEISGTYSECVSVALVFQHATHMRCFVICSLSGFTIFFSTLSHKRYDFREKVTEYKMRFGCLCIFVCTISHSKKKSTRYDHKWTYIGVRVKYPLFCPILMKLELFCDIFTKFSNIKFN